MKRRVCSQLLLVALCGLFTSSAIAQEAPKEQYVLSMGTVATKGTPWSKQLEDMKKRIEKASNGRIKVKLFFGTAGGEKAIARQVKNGQLQGAGITLGALATLVPEMNVFELPYLFDSYAQADAIIDGYLFKPTEEILQAYGFQLYIFSENGYRDFATADRCIRKPADLGGLKMRAQESWVHEETYRAFGGNPVRIPVPETLEALNTGNVQGFDNTVLYAFAASWHQAVKYWTRSGHIYQPAVLVYNKDWFDKLPKDLQELLLAEREAETVRGRKLIRAIEPKLVDNLKAAKIEICELSAAERGEFVKRVKPVYDKFRKEGGKRGVELLDLVLKNKK
jgi:TRAP-type C4-dicarboxylate transport system substrate-binding protein